MNANLEETPARRRRRWPFVLLGVVVAGLLAAGAVLLWLQRQFDPPGPPGAEVALTIPPGSSTAAIAARLDRAGVVGDARMFRLYLRLNGGGPFQAGDYTFRRRLAFADVVEILDDGPKVVYQRLTLPEGLTVDQVAERVGRLPGRSKDRFLELARSGQVRSKFQPPGSTNLEGFLFPNTYLFEERDDELAILRRLVASFDEVADEVGLARSRATVGLSPYETVVAASLVEREGKVDADRPKIARVIRNRLDKGMLLQIDATVLYALGSHKTRVLFRDLEVDSPYNTYKVKGLPPGPIASPGRAALVATLRPEPGPWLYYVVVSPDGRHAFATTGAEHQANIRQAERNGVR